MINNAGIFIGKPFTDYTLEDFDALIAVNLRRLLPTSRRERYATCSIVAPGISSMSRRRWSSTRTARGPAALQTLTKGGLVAATKSLAIEYAPHGLRVNAVSLGVIETPVHDRSSYAALGALHPLGRVGEIEDVVGGVLYLESATFVTGEILHIDGGQSAGR